jgi:aspartate/methionine/tyrosine aminotransferase
MLIDSVYYSFPILSSYFTNFFSVSTFVFFFDSIKLCVFSDEIYDALTYDDIKNTSILTFPKIQDQTVYIHGFSKTYSMTEWRLEYIAAPPKIVDEMSKIQQNSTTYATSFAQKAAVEH